ncbi:MULTISPECIES: sigma factor-like helix-turn-helix DNA-binding protein [unclassified Actinopolyspora]|uniref:sigma factor-like helix-turn-helix DNA-binding protein n=1 Tax=unclassified Actinopolyspora TaxID=2639451 RepID=UPI0013F646DB|nr:MULTISPECIES: sigma factor-like helix-turn-helix DNA-binding protein [unclassified Actinopolyspora]NHD17739.1 hypothetical protein [Actinopolyspora sp. BKK2]NHE76528.1 hypothetical protein [Actinopolyspora sp. BKK1]
MSYLARRILSTGNNSRAIEMAKLYEEGFTMSSIGKKYGVTHERVRQILKKNGRISNAEARNVRLATRNDRQNQKISNFLEGHKESISFLAESGISRLEAEKRFNLIFPHLDGDIISRAFDASGEIFEIDYPDYYRFSDNLLEGAVWFVIGRMLNLHRNHSVAIKEMDTEEALEISKTLQEENFSEEDVSNIICLIISARHYLITGKEDVTLTGKLYRDYRAEILEEFGNSSRKGSSSWPPTDQTIMKRLGNGYWADAMRNIGVSPGTIGRSRGLLVFEEEDYTQAVADYLDHAALSGQVPTFDRYSNWVAAEERSGRRRPSSDSVRIRYKTWTSAKRAAYSEKPSSETNNQISGERVSSVGTDALHRAQTELDLFLESSSGIRRQDIPSESLNFVKKFAEEFEINRRDWLRSMIKANPYSVSNRLDGDFRGKLTKKIISELKVANPDLDCILPDKYFDSLLADGDPRDMDGWVPYEAQQEIDSISEEDVRRFKVIRCLRNFATHNSSESRQKLEDAISQIADIDQRFNMKQTITRRTLGDWLCSSNQFRLRYLCSCISNIWRAMIVGENFILRKI